MQMYNIKKGFTLVEIMIAIAIMALVSYVAMSFFQRTNRSFYQGQLKYIVDSEAQILIEYVKRDLSMSCKLELDGKHLTESIIDAVESGDTFSYKFERFYDYVDGEPKAKKVEYTFDKSEKTVTRELEGEATKVWDKIENFYINYYGLLPHHRYFYNIQIELKAGHENDVAKSEVFRIQTSVESKYENHLVNFPGWLKNSNSIISNE